MKKNNKDCCLSWQWQNFLLTMKLIVIFILVGLVSAHATETYSQTTHLDLNMKNASLKSILSAIEEKTEFNFFFKADEIEELKNLTIETKQASISEILNYLLKDNGFEYEIFDRYILIQKKGGNQSVSQLVQQQRSVSGKVTDSSGAPLPGVTVLIKGTTQGIITDTNGNYSLTNVARDATLIFSFVGMKTQEIPTSGKTSINVVMQEETVGLEEVVAVGYGTQRKGNVTGAISTVKSNDLTVAPVASPTNALAGRLPGLISVQSSGQPGYDAASLSIRGFGNALVIVDGVESSLNSIDPNQIESISILKDGSASIYGSRAGNGVILVTTKRGTVQKPTITLNSSYTLQGITTVPKPCNAGQYAELVREAWLQSGQPAENAPFTEEAIQKYYQGGDPLYPNTDWYNELVRPWAPQQQHNLSVQGGSDKIKYYGLVGYLDQGVMFKNDGGNYRRYNFQSNIDAKILDNLSLQLTLSSIVEDINYPHANYDKGSGESAWLYFWSTLPIYPAHFPDPTKLPFTGSVPGGLASTNRSIYGYNDTDKQNLKGSLALNYSVKAIKGLSAKAFVNYDRNYSTNKAFSKPVKFYTYDPESQIYTFSAAVGSQAFLDMSDSKDLTLTGQLSLHYDNTLGKDHHITALALYEFINYKGDWFSAHRQNFLTTAIDQLFAGSTNGMSNNGSASEMGRASYVGRLNYSYQNKYLIETILRADASAKFPKDSRWGYFPSVSLGWRVSEENFMKSFSSLSDLKLRAAFGEAGNDNIGNFQYLAGYQFDYFSYLLGSGSQKGLGSKGLANPYLTWEKMKLYNVGLDFSFFNRKLYGEGDVFYRERDGIMATRLLSMPSTFGATLPPENINSQNNRGFELKLGTAGNKRDLSWDVSGNISWSRAKWGHFEEPAYTDSDQVRIYQRSGRWTDLNFGYLSDGLFTSQAEIDALPFNQDNLGNTTLKPGDIRYKDVNNDGKLDWRDMVEIGKGTMPHWMVGASVNLRYKNFDLSALLQGAFGYYTYIKYYTGDLKSSNPSNFATYVYKSRWTEQNNNRNASIPRLGSYGSPNSSYYSDFYLKKAGYMRLKVFSLGYSIPERYLQRINMKQVRIYLSGTNLLTFDKLKKYNLDPEAPSFESGTYYPQQKTISLGVNVSL